MKHFGITWLMHYTDDVSKVRANLIDSGLTFGLAYRAFMKRKTVYAEELEMLEDLKAMVERMEAHAKELKRVE